ncbi:MAG: TonB-dependent receptor [Lentibacter algarum]|jgi:vitamin B12 transporter|uniref:Vitamin B12 transporter n=2 Tax=Lentibacter algarum TaxID=576131 RepID=A0A1H3M9E2_9RHOB|nr:TonB-dependent receptor [Lentibacter algarum]MCO4778265.1 TonB-dependent receptor [Lentibacter algarum]MCO4828879.1 TonB-dependent receptor [Lentibacter algarum]SDY72904.1 vitamin B12 transporter [Lentibacter algarum]
MHSTLKASAALALLISHTPAYAQEAFDLGEITLFSNQVLTELSRSGTTTEVVTEDEIAAAPETSVSDILATLPGVTTTATGGVGAQTTLRIRGLGAGYVPVYLDGIDISDPASTGAGYNWGGLTTGGLSRIEVLKGGQSARFGVNAAGGVVNLSSYRPTREGFSGQSAVEFGAYGTKSASLGLGFMDERTEVGFSLSKFETDGFSAASAGIEDDGYSSTRVSFFLEYELSDTARLGASMFYFDTAGEFDQADTLSVSPWTALNVEGTYDEVNASTTFGARTFLEIDSGVVKHKLAVSFFDIDRISDNSGSITPFKGERKTLGYTATYTFNETTLWTFGLDHMAEETATASADINSAYAEVAFAASDKLDLTGSLRYDDHSDLGGQATGRLAAAYRFSDDVILRAQAATGYKPPSLFQSTTNAAKSTVALAPEDNTTFELGLEKTYGEVGFVRVTAFYNDLRNHLVYESSCSTPTNLITPGYCYAQSNFKSKGLELSGAYALNDTWELTGAYTYTDAYRPTGRAGRVPRHDLHIGVSGDFANGFAGGLGVNYVADRFDRDNGSTPMPDFKTVNAHVSYQFNDSTQAYLRVENLFDEDYEAVNGFNTSDRALYFGVRASF